MDDVRHIHDDAVLKAVSRPERMAMLRHLMLRPATLTQLGELLGHHAAWVRHHLLTLEQAGLVELVDERPVRGFTEKYYGATARAFAVDFMILPEEGERGLLVVVGSDDPALTLLASCLRADPAAPDVVTLTMGSLEGLIALRQGVGDVAGCHLPDPAGDDFNRSYVSHLFPGHTLTLVTLAHRDVGLIVATGNPLGLHGLADVARTGARFVNRNAGSGTRVWIDRLLHEAGLTGERLNGYGEEVLTHADVAGAVAEGRAQAGFGVAAVLRPGLELVPLYTERYDLVVPNDRLGLPAVVSMLARLDTAEFRASIAALAGYHAEATGARTEIVA
jgi:putative molybdopterin biosynthesis protein